MHEAVDYQNGRWSLAPRPGGREARALRERFAQQLAHPRVAQREQLVRLHAQPVCLRGGGSEPCSARYVTASEPERAADRQTWRVRLQLSHGKRRLAVVRFGEDGVIFAAHQRVG